MRAVARSRHQNLFEKGLHVAFMRPRNEGIDPMARVNAARDIFAALPGIWTKSLTDEVLARNIACTPLQPSRPMVAISDPAVFINCHHRNHTAIREEHVVKRTISVHEDLLAFARNVFELRHKPPEIAGWQGEQKPIAGPI